MDIVIVGTAVGGGSRYVFFEARQYGRRLSWQEAKLACKSKQMELVKIDNKFEDKNLLDLIALRCGMDSEHYFHLCIFYKIYLFHMYVFLLISCSLSVYIVI